MTTLRLSDLEMRDALIADLHTRADLVADPIPVGERTVVSSTGLEYRVIYVARSMGGLPNEGVEENLNTAAREGWRLVGSLTNDEARTTGLIMERQTPTAGVA